MKKTSNSPLHFSNILAQKYVNKLVKMGTTSINNMYPNFIIKSDYKLHVDVGIRAKLDMAVKNKQIVHVTND